MKISGVVLAISLTIPSNSKSETFHKELVPIAKLETSGGKNLNHKKNKNGPFYTAHGILGLKPSTAYDTYKKSPSLQYHWPNLDMDSFLSMFHADDALYNACANKHWELLKKFTGDIYKSVFAWRWGVGKMQNTEYESILSDPYVIKYMLHSNVGG